MKQTLLIVLLLIACGIMAYDHYFRSSRYQAVPATYTIWQQNGEASHVSTIFRVDTWTGQTWRYVEGQGAKEGYSVWMKIPE